MQKAHLILHLLILPLYFIRAEAGQIWTDTNKHVLFDLILAPVSCNTDPWKYNYSKDINYFPRLSHVYNNQAFRIYVAPRYVETDTEGLAILKMDLEVLAPDGSTYHNAQGLRIYKSKPPKNIDAFMVIDRPISVVFENDDPQGTYTFKISLLDEVSGHRSQQSIDVNLVPFETKSFFKNEKHYEQWLHRYYTHQDPGIATTAYLHMAPMSFSWGDSEIGAQLYIQSQFYELILGANRWILPHLNDQLPGASPLSKQKTLYLFARLQYSAPGLYVQLNKTMRQFYDWASSFQLPSAEEPIVTPLQLDLEWSRFFATGQFKPINRIVKLLELAPYAPDADIELGKDSPKALVEKASKGTLFKATVWSLSSNVKHHPLIHSYCEYILRQNELTDDAQEILIQILQKHPPKRTNGI